MPNFDWPDLAIVPDWARQRQLGAVNALAFVAPRPTKAKPLDRELIANALREQFGVLGETRDYGDLDVWFCKFFDGARQCNWHMILYEYRGEWECASLRKEPYELTTAWDLASPSDKTALSDKTATWFAANEWLKGNVDYKLPRNAWTGNWSIDNE